MAAVCWIPQKGGMDLLSGGSSIIRSCHPRKPSPFGFTKLIHNPKAFGGVSPTAQVQRQGPMHTRTDINLEKTWGDENGVQWTLGTEIYNLFNQKDPRSVPGRRGQEI